jgi:hypothetical protein
MPLTLPAAVAGRPGWNYRGAFDPAAIYAVGDLVLYHGSTYVATSPTGAPINLLPAGSFAFETDTGGWGANEGAPTITRDSSVFHSGVASLKVVASGGASTSIFRAPGFPTVAGTAFVFGVWVLLSAARSVSIDISPSPDVYPGPSIAVPAGAWTQVTRMFTATAAEHYIWPSLRGASSGDVAWYDDMSLTGTAAFDPAGWDLIADAGLPAYTTAGRPAAADLGTGRGYYDTTTSKPMWSTGSAYKDASGA